LLEGLQGIVNSLLNKSLKFSVVLAQNKVLNESTVFVLERRTSQASRVARVGSGNSIVNNYPKCERVWLKKVGLFSALIYIQFVLQQDASIAEHNVLKRCHSSNLKHSSENAHYLEIVS
jgi:hypothetical protein